MDEHNSDEMGEALTSGQALLKIWGEIKSYLSSMAFLITWVLLANWVWGLIF